MLAGYLARTIAALFMKTRPGEVKDLRLRLSGLFSF
jgi:hypothetical protein